VNFPELNLFLKKDLIADCFIDIAFIHGRFTSDINVGKLDELRLRQALQSIFELISLQFQASVKSFSEALNPIRKILIQMSIQGDLKIRQKSKKIISTQKGKTLINQSALKILIEP